MRGTSPTDIILLQVLVNAAWVLLPLVPAILTYLVAPKRPISAEGPLGGLTIKAGGAFAAYLIVLLVTYPLVNNQNKAFSLLQDREFETSSRPIWTITGSVLVQDETGRTAPPSDNEAMEVTLQPPIVELDQQKREFEVLVPEVDKRLSRIVVSYLGYGSTSINPGAPSEGEMITRDEEKRVITINSPLIIRREGCRGLSCGGGAPDAPNP